MEMRMGARRCRRRGCLGSCLPAGVVLALTATAPAQVEEASWDNPLGGSWGVDGNWDSTTGQFPTERPGQTWRAIIDLSPGADYTIDLDLDVTLEEFELTTSDALLSSTSASGLTVRERIMLDGGRIEGLGALVSEGVLVFDADDDECDDICDLPVSHTGTAIRKTGEGDIRLGGTTLFEQAAGSVFTIEGGGDVLGDATATLRNRGAIRKQSPGETRIEDVLFDNTGTVAVERGTLTITNPALPAPGVLGPARYEVDAGATLDLPGTLLAENRADVVLGGAGASFAQLASITRNEGSVIAAGGATIAFTDQGVLTNAGLLEADGVGSRIESAGAIAVDGGTARVVNGGVIAAGGGGGTLTLSGGGTLEGNGTAQAALVGNNGVVSPGQSPGVLRVENAIPGEPAIYQQQQDGELFIEIQGRQPGSDFDVLEVAGIVDIQGGDLRLAFSPFGSGSPVTVGDEFQVITSQQAFGGFDDVIVQGLGGEGAVEVLFVPDGLRVVVTAVPAPGSAGLLVLGACLALGRRRRA